MSKQDTINWENGIWVSDREAETDAEILIAGDWAPIRGFSDMTLERPEAVYGDLLPVLRDSDLRIANLECPLSDVGTAVHKSGAVFKGISAHIEGLATVPFDVVTLANNHVFDYGIDAFVETVTQLEKYSIQYTGAGLSITEAEKPIRTRAKGVEVGIVSFSEGEDLTAAAPEKPGVLGWEVDRVIECVSALRQKVHAIIVICHGGVEYIPYPPPYLADALRRVAEAGADLVIGHHPHVPQGVEIHEGVPICYSLGNFVFYQPVDFFYRKIGYLVKAGVGKHGVGRVQLIPYWIGDEGLSLLRNDELKRCLRKLELLSEPLSRKGGVAEAWHGFLKYYGVSGFKAEIASILQRFDEEREKGAAMFRNRLTTLQHRHHLADLMTRIVEGTLDGAPDWAVDMVEEFLTRRIADGFFE